MNVKTTMHHSPAQHQAVADESIMEMKIDAYEADMAERARFDERIDQFMAAKVCGPAMDVCPFCGEPLWMELGYWSWNEELLWEGFYYRVIDFPVDHHRY